MWPEIAGSLVCHGHEGQYIVVVPDRDLVVVHLGKTPSEATPQLRARLRAMIAAL
jgi:CubicO group peptidase (beta-lactamase class C family)